MIAVHIPDEENPEYTVSYALYNPKIISNSAAKCYLAGGEGCLSVEEEKKGYDSGITYEQVLSIFNSYLLFNGRK